MNAPEYECRIREEIAAISGWDTLDPAVKVSVIIKLAAATFAAKDKDYAALVDRMLRRAYP